MNENTPPHDGSYANPEDMDEMEEVYEIENEEDLELLEDQMVNDESLIIENETQDELAKVIFSEHKGSVFCVSFSSKENLVATGGEDDLAYIWDIETGSVYLKCTNHKDSVTMISFSHDGTYLATGDMSGYIQVWNVSKRSKVWDFETNDLNWLLWHSSSNILLAGTCSGEVWMWLIPQGHTKSLCHAGISTECGSLMKDGKRICVGFKDGSIRILDLKTEQTLHTLNNHSQQITSLSVHSDGILAMSGCLDGKAVVFNTVSGKSIATLDCTLPEEGEMSVGSDEANTVEVVSFCPTNPTLAVTATLSGIVTIWDIASQTSRHHIIQGCGTSSVKWHPKNSYFCTAGLDGTLRIYDARSAEQKIKCVGHSQSILSCDFNYGGSHIVTVSDDGTAKVFNVGGFVT